MTCGISMGYLWDIYGLSYNLIPIYSESTTNLHRIGYAWESKWGVNLCYAFKVKKPGAPWQRLLSCLFSLNSSEASFLFSKYWLLERFFYLCKGSKKWTKERTIGGLVQQQFGNRRAKCYYWIFVHGCRVVILFSIPSKCRLHRHFSNRYGQI